MKLEQSFDVAAPADRVWQALIDVEQVAPCLPGAAVTGRNDDGSYNGTFTIKIGPTTASYTGKLEMTEVDDHAHTATLHAQGNDKRGQGGANATIVSRVTTAGADATHVEVSTDYHITGRLARFGRGGMIEDISQRLLKEFAARLQSSLAGGSADAGGKSADGADSARVPPAAEAPAPVSAEAPAPVSAEAPAPVSAEAEVPAPTEVVAPAAAAAAAADGDGAVPPPPEAAVPPPEPDIAEPPPPPRPAEPSEPLQAHDVVGGVLLDRIKRNPAPVIGLAVLLMLMRWRRRRRKRRQREALAG